MTNIKKFFTTGEFAKAFGVSKQTLIYYDNIGIFKPDYKDDNNFRFYSLHQYESFDILLTLRSLGMTLEDIRLYLDNKSPDNVIKMLNNENKKIQDKICLLEMISKKIQNKIDIINYGINSMDIDKPHIKYMDEEFLIKYEVTSFSEEDIIFNAIELINYCVKNNIYSGYPMGATINKDNIMFQNYMYVDALFVKIDNKIESDRLYIKNKGLYACINHTGNYYSAQESYEKLLKFIHDNGYKIAGDSYEFTLFDALIVSSEDDYLTEISIEVFKE